MQAPTFLILLALSRQLRPSDSARPDNDVAAEAEDFLFEPEPELAHAFAAGVPVFFGAGLADEDGAEGPHYLDARLRPAPLFTDFASFSGPSTAFGTPPLNQSSLPFEVAFESALTRRRFFIL